jgi:hypothetical protein
MYLVDTRDKFVLDHFAISIPIFPVFEGAPFKVTSTAVNENGYEEDRVEVRDGGGEANDGAPEEGHNPISGVVLNPWSVRVIISTGEDSQACERMPRNRWSTDDC